MPRQPNRQAKKGACTMHPFGEGTSLNGAIQDSAPPPKTGRDKKSTEDAIDDGGHVLVEAIAHVCACTLPEHYTLASKCSGDLVSGNMLPSQHRFRAKSCNNMLWAASAEPERPSSP